MSSVLYYEPLYLDRFVDGVFPTGRAGIPCAMPSGIPGAIPGATPGGILGGIPGGIPMAGAQKPVDIVAAMKSLKPT